MGLIKLIVIAVIAVIIYQAFNYISANGLEAYKNHLSVKFKNFSDKANKALENFKKKLGE